MNNSKKLVLISLLITSLLSVKAQSLEFVIEGTLKDFKNDARIWLGLVEPYENKGMAFQSNVVDGKFSIKGNTYEPTIATLSLFMLDKNGKPVTIYPEAKRLSFFLCAGNNYVTIKDSFDVIQVRNNCPAGVNDDYRYLIESEKKYEAELEELYKKHFRAKTADSMALYAELGKQIKRVSEQLKPLYKTYISKHPKSLLSLPLFKLQMATFNEGETDTLFNGLSKSLQQSPMGKEIARKISLNKNPAVKLIGTSMPDITLSDATGEITKLSLRKGKYMFLDFWASWCSPCRKAFPELKKIYATVDTTKLQFIAVSIDASKTDWLNAVKADALPWPQYIDQMVPGKSVYHARGFSSYRGESIPLSFLIDPAGKIIEINPSIEILRRVINVKR